MIYSTISPGLVIILTNGKKLVCFHGGIEEDIIEFAIKKTQPTKYFNITNLSKKFCQREKKNCQCTNIHKEDKIYQNFVQNDITVIRGHETEMVFFS